MINPRVFFTGLCFLAALLTGCAREELPTYSMTGTIEARDGVPIVYETIGEGDIAVLFIHCWACNRAFWRHQIKPVVEAGYQVVALDLPGHGDSGAGREEWSIAALAVDVKTVVDSLDLQKVVLVGHAVGGRVALTAVPHMRENVLGIGCVDTIRNAEFKWPEGVDELLLQLIHEEFSSVLRSSILPVIRPGTDPELVEWIFSQTERSDQTALIKLLVDVSRSDLSADLVAADTRVRCINAAPAGSYSMPTQIEINRKYADFDVLLMEGAGHYPQLELPEVFNAHLLDVLAELTGRGH